MLEHQYNPDIHRRRSIRLRGMIIRGLERIV